MLISGKAGAEAADDVRVLVGQHDGLECIRADVAQHFREHRGITPRATRVEEHAVFVDDQILVGADAVFFAGLAFVQQDEAVVVRAEQGMLRMQSIPRIFHFC